jgi:hypothetical protein
VPKASLSFIASMPQIKGRFGFQEDRYFDVPFTMHEKGGMNSEAHRLWHQHLRTYFPDAADAPRQRVITKAD